MKFILTIALFLFSALPGTAAGLRVLAMAADGQRSVGGFEKLLTGPLKGGLIVSNCKGDRKGIGGS